jgi:hypothetical protein
VTSEGTCSVSTSFRRLGAMSSVGMRQRVSVLYNIVGDIEGGSAKVCLESSIVGPVTMKWVSLRRGASRVVSKPRETTTACLKSWSFPLPKAWLCPDRNTYKAYRLVRGYERPTAALIP